MRIGSPVNLLIAAAGCVYLLSGCTKVVDPGEVGVYVEKPIFGAGKVDADVAVNGRHFYLPTTDLVTYSIQPYRIDESFTDLITQDNWPVSFSAYLQVQLVPQGVPALHQNFGSKFYEANIQQPFRTMVRDFARSHKAFDLTSDPKVTAEGQEQLEAAIRKLVAEEGIPINVTQVVIGAVTPPKEVLDETARTAAQQQRVKTEIARADAEASRKHAEENKAAADRAYSVTFGMDANQFLVYRSLEIKRELVEMLNTKNNVSVVVNAGGGVNDVVPTFETRR